MNAPTILRRSLTQAAHRLDRAKTEHHRCVWEDGVREERYCAAEDELAAARAAYRKALGEAAGADVAEVERLLSL